MFRSGDGARQFRMTDSDILGKHWEGPHVNFETLIENPAKPGKMKLDQRIHLLLVE